MKKSVKAMKIGIALMLCLILVLQMGCNKEPEAGRISEEAPKVAEASDEVAAEGEGEPSPETNQSAMKMLNSQAEQLSKNNALFAEFSAETITPKWNFPEMDLIGDWGDMPAPPISPLGEKQAYEQTGYEENSEYTFEYIDDNQVVRQRHVYGEKWTMSIPENSDYSNEENAQFFYDYRQIIEANGGIGFTEYRNQSTYFYQKEGHHYWVEANYGSYQLQITVMEERQFEINETVVVKPAEIEGNEIYYSTELPEDKFISLISSIDQGRGNISLDLETSYGDYQRHTEITTVMDEKAGLNYVDDDYVNEPGTAYIRVYWQDSDTPETITFMFEAKHDVEPITYGEQLGGITLLADHVSNVEISPTIGDDLVIQHPEYNPDKSYFDKNQEEGFITFVPAGYYELNIYMKDGLVDKFKTLKVPVHSGKMTEVVVPQSLTDGIKNREATEEEGIFISDVTEKEDQVSFVFSLIDNQTREVEPDKENSAIFEGGTDCEIVSIEPIPTPPNIVVLLDSSGSMKGQMEQTIEAAKTFIDGLPADTNLTIIDFDTEPKRLEGASLSELRSQLDTVKANGATALYDSVIMGLEMLDGKERPTLVVFTDGEDANYDDTARGSKATFEEAINAIDTSTTPLYTIGFGEGHDSATLETFAELSLGKYYSADDQDALVKVFESINNKLGNTYLATYKRPLATSISDIPVVSFVVDVSGSMYSDFYDESSFRLDDVKVIYHDFLQSLPEETQVMVTSFNSEINIQQGITTDKMLALNAIGNLEAQGGTAIYKSVAYGYESLKKVASSKKIMIYLTDAALEVEDEEQEKFNERLDEINNSNIQTLWVGMGVNDPAPFEKAAALSGGDYIISDDAQVLSDKFQVMLNEVKNAPASDNTAISLNIKKKTDNGAYEAFSSSVLYGLSPVKRSDDVIVLDTIDYRVSDYDVVSPYDKVTSNYISGDTIPGEQTLITERITVDASGKNEAMKMQAQEIIFSSRLAGVDAPNGQRFMAVLMDLSNVLAEQEVVVYPDGSGHPSSWVNGGAKGEVKTAKIPYSIPNFMSHFGMSYNGQGPYPAATATWLAFEPIVVPGTYDLTLQPDATKKGMMVFVVPDEPMEQLGIHYFDDNYGHIDMPVVGQVPKVDTTYGGASGTAVKLMDNFSLEVGSYSKTNVLEEPIEQSQHRVVEGKFVSDVKAVIDVVPSERIYMRFATNNGDFYTPLSPTTADTPYGFYTPTAIAPGAQNPVKLLFQMPEKLEDNRSEIFFDLKDEDVVVPVSTGSSYDAQVLDSFETDYFKADINKLSLYEGDIAGYNRNWVIADVTIHDYLDGFATRGAANNFYLDYEGGEPTKVNDTIESGSLGSFAASNTYGYGGASRIQARVGNDLEADNYTSELLFGMDEETIVYDGTSRRGFILFSIDQDNLSQPWMLSFDDTALKVPMATEIDASLTSLLVKKEEYEIDSTYEEDFEEALNKAVADYKLRYPQALRTPVVNEAVYDEVVMPSANAYGYEMVSQIQSVEDLEQTLRSLRFINSGNGTQFNYLFSKEALLTQGFGTEGDMANFAIEMLSRLGYKTKRMLVVPTEKGEEILAKMAGLERTQVYQLPAVSYVNDHGERRILVLPFARDIQELEGLVYYEGENGGKPTSPSRLIQVYYDLLPTEEGHTAMINNMAGALSGGSGEVEVFSEDMNLPYIPLATLSKDAVDIGTAIVGNKAYTVLYTADGEMMSDNYIDLNLYGIRGMGVVIDGVDHHVAINEEMEANQVFMTLGYNLPEIPEEAAKMISEQMAASSNLQPDTLSSLKWLHRKALYSFIANQTAFERGMEEGSEMVTGRIDNPRAVLVQSTMTDQLTMSVDLMHIQNDLHTGDEETQNSYRLMSGLSASQLEAEVLDNGLGFKEFWDQMPDEAHLVLFNTSNIDSQREAMAEKGMSEAMIAYFEDMGNKMILIQSDPSMINGEPRWAWLEMGYYDYDTISVLDTFEHGSMASNATLNSMLDKAQYVVGAFKGVETSVWAVSAFSLELTDYEEIKASALAFALAIGENFETEIGPIKLEGGKKPELTGPTKEIYDFFTKAEKEEESKGFKEGYKDGVEFYFKIAK